MKNHAKGPGSPLGCSSFQARIQSLGVGCVLFGLCNSLNTRHFAIKCLFNDRAHRMEHSHFLFEQRSEAANVSSHRRVRVPLHTNLALKAY